MNLEQIYSKNILEEKELEFEGEKFTVKFKPVTWARKSTIVHQCMTYSKKGDAHFDYGHYMEEMLIAMEAEGFWGKTDYLFLKKITPAFGKVLEQIVPPPVEGSVDESDFFGEKSEKF